MAQPAVGDLASLRAGDVEAGDALAVPPPRLQLDRPALDHQGDILRVLRGRRPTGVHLRPKAQPPASRNPSCRGGGAVATDVGRATRNSPDSGSLGGMWPVGERAATGEPARGHGPGHPAGSRWDRRQAPAGRGRLGLGTCRGLGLGLQAGMPARRRLRAPPPPGLPPPAPARPPPAPRPPRPPRPPGGVACSPRQSAASSPLRLRASSAGLAATGRQATPWRACRRLAGGRSGARCRRAVSRGPTVPARILPAERPGAAAALAWLRGDAGGGGTFERPSGDTGDTGNREGVGIRGESAGGERGTPGEPMGGGREQAGREVRLARAAIGVRGQPRKETRGGEKKERSGATQRQSQQERARQGESNRETHELRRRGGVKESRRGDEEETGRRGDKEKRRS